MEPKVIQVFRADKLPRHLLYLADPSPSMVATYLQNGKYFLLELDHQICGLMVLQEREPDKSIEIMNLAITPTFQRKGFGKLLLKHAIQYAKIVGYEELWIATGNSSIGQLRLYQKMGFEIENIIYDF